MTVNPGVYHIGVAAKLFNAGDQSYLIDRLISDIATFPQNRGGGGYYRRLTWFIAHIDISGDNYIAANNPRWLKIILPERIEYAQNVGPMPNLPFTSPWTIVIGKENISKVPRGVYTYDKAISQEDFRKLGTSASSIDLDGLDYATQVDSNPLPR